MVNVYASLDFFLTREHKLVSTFVAILIALNVKTTGHALSVAKELNLSMESVSRYVKQVFTEMKKIRIEVVMSVIVTARHVLIRQNAVLHVL